MLVSVLKLDEWIFLSPFYSIIFLAVYIYLNTSAPTQRHTVLFSHPLLLPIFLSDQVKSIQWNTLAQLPQTTKRNNFLQREVKSRKKYSRGLQQTYPLWPQKQGKWWARSNKATQTLHLQAHPQAHTTQMTDCFLTFNQD